MSDLYPAVYKIVLDFPAVDHRGHDTLKSLTYGGKNRTRPFDENDLRQAHEEVISAYTPQELSIMGIPTIRRLVLDRYNKRHPMRVQLAKKQYLDIQNANPDKDKPNKNNTFTKDNITLIDPASEGGSTAFLIGGSKSGKTTLLVQSLINLLRSRELRDRYNIIIIFSESLNAMPLQDLPARKDLKIIIFPMYIPELVKLAQKINYKTNNRYGFYFILDDCNELRGGTLKRQILQMRNAGISTLVATQYVKNIGPGPRGSFHHIYITGARTPPDREFIIKEYMDPYLRDKGIKDKDQKDEYLREHTKLEPNQRELIHIDIVNDEMDTHFIKK